MNRLMLLLALSTVTASGFAQHAISSTLDLGARADANYNSAPVTINTFSASQGASTATLSGSANAVDVDSGFTASSGTSVTASWAGAGIGSIVATGGWSFTAGTGGGAALHGPVTGLPVWTYTFKMTNDGTLTFDYNVVGHGNKFGLQAWWFDITGGPTMYLGPDVIYPDGSGTITKTLFAGQTYTMAIGNNANISGGVGGYNGSYDGNFDWRIQTVPEPFSMSALAFGFVAVARRRRK